MVSLVNGDSWWSCRIGGTDQEFSERDRFKSWDLKPCHGEGSQTNAASLDQSSRPRRRARRRFFGARRRNRRRYQAPIRLRVKSGSPSYLEVGTTVALKSWRSASFCGVRSRSRKLVCDRKVPQGKRIPDNFLFRVVDGGRNRVSLQHVRTLWFCGIGRFKRGQIVCNFRRQQKRTRFREAQQGSKYDATDTGYFALLRGDSKRYCTIGRVKRRRNRRSKRTRLSQNARRARRKARRANRRAARRARRGARRGRGANIVRCKRRKFSPRGLFTVVAFKGWRQARRPSNATLPPRTQSPTLPPTQEFVRSPLPATSAPTLAPTLAPMRAATPAPPPGPAPLPAGVVINFVDYQNCVSAGSRAQCATCTHTSQCASGFCCPYMKKCVASSSTPCYLPIAECVPPCHVLPCSCKNQDFPTKWLGKDCAR